MEFKDILIGHSESVIAIASILRNKILSLDSDISEDVFVGDLGHQASYSIGNIHNVIAVISPAEDHCKVYLHYFDQVSTYPLQLEGKGKHSRHISLHDPEELPRAELKRVLHEITLMAKGK
ncbi:MAG: hypothetical protein GY751_03705 [Bacteroidetes bacterium]|nr:hypothetical protein [Bacteroidota bacterium]